MVEPIVLTDRPWRQVSVRPALDTPACVTAAVGARHDTRSV